MASDETTGGVRANLVRIGTLSVLIVLVISSGAMGYRYLLGWSWIDALYMTAITISTVGFAEVRALTVEGRLLTILLMLLSAGLYAYVLTTLASVVVEARFGSILWRRRMDARIRQLRDHYVVCGFGRTGRAVCDNLVRGGRDLVVIEHDPEALLLLREADHLFVRGNATDDECLHRARIDHAAGLVAALGSDADNVYLVLSARQIKPDLAIVSWAASMESERKLLRAGANHAISPYLLSGRRMANLLATPHALEFMDHVLGGSDNIRLGEFAVESGSRLQNHSLIDAGIRRDVGVIVIGIRRADGTLEFNPPADTVLHENDVVIGIGAPDQIDRLRRLI